MNAAENTLTALPLEDRRSTGGAHMLFAAVGYMELEMWQEAWEELNRCEMQGGSSGLELLKVRLELLNAVKEKLLETVDGLISLVAKSPAAVAHGGVAKE